MNCGSRSHGQRVANPDRGIADTHGNQGHRASMLFRQAQPFFHRAGRGRVQLMGHSFAHHALGIGIDLDSDGGGGYDFTADDYIHGSMLPNKNRWFRYNEGAVRIRAPRRYGTLPRAQKAPYVS